MILAMGNSAVLLTVWVTFLVIMLAGIFAVLVWAVRSGQFSHQDRARYLALRSHIPPEHATPNGVRPKDASEEKRDGDAAS